MDVAAYLDRIGYTGQREPTLAALRGIVAAHARSITFENIDPLLGRGSLHASVIRGGVGMSTYPEECVLSIERRTLPGETADDAVREVENACAAVSARDPRLDARITQTTSQFPSDVPIDSPSAKQLKQALEGEGVAVRIEGMSAWTDAALLNAAGIPTICFGPGDIGLAHAAEEFVPIAEIETATRVLGRLVHDWCNG